jgi:hypothetical protein
MGYRAGGLGVSANLPTSPWGSDHLIISSHSRRDGRRMVSEDSQEFGWLPMIHRLNDLRDLGHPTSGEMRPRIHHADDLGELLKVSSLAGSQWVFPEERNNDVPQISKSVDRVPSQMLSVIVVPTVDSHRPTTERTSEIFKNFAARL